VLCRDPEYDGWWETKADLFCYATAATEQWRRSKPKDWEPEPGQLLSAVLDPEAVAAQSNIGMVAPDS
jgi:hypothetical protein